MMSTWRTFGYIEEDRWFESILQPRCRGKKKLGVGGNCDWKNLVLTFRNFLKVNTRSVHVQLHCHHFRWPMRAQCMSSTICLSPSVCLPLCLSPPHVCRVCVSYKNKKFKKYINWVHYCSTLKFNMTVYIQSLPFLKLPNSSVGNSDSGKQANRYFRAIGESLASWRILSTTG